ncbi:MAG TPA: hypothetical protein VGY13_04165 [Solirubrobacteraceae bacterium]|jgi:hypothetical protein|nr:hypothetical protein [Solirubrobacteraceae bacterium]
MSFPTDPLEQLRRANPVPSPTPTDWPTVLERIRRERAGGPADSRRPPHPARAHGRASWPHRATLAGLATACVCALALAAAALVLLANRNGHEQGRSRLYLATAPTAARHEPHRPSRRAGAQGGIPAVLAPDAHGRALRASTCAVRSPACAHGCTIPVVSRALAPLAPAKQAGGCATKATGPCAEMIRGAGPGKLRLRDLDLELIRLRRAASRGRAARTGICPPARPSGARAPGGSGRAPRRHGR